LWVEPEIEDWDEWPVGHSSNGADCGFFGAGGLDEATRDDSLSLRNRARPGKTGRAQVAHLRTCDYVPYQCSLGLGDGA
jgi:hypothetical protein